MPADYFVHYETMSIKKVHYIIVKNFLQFISNGFEYTITSIKFLRIDNYMRLFCINYILGFKFHLIMQAALFLLNALFRISTKTIKSC